MQLAGGIRAERLRTGDAGGWGTICVVIDTHNVSFVT
jgi:hypothetical protein